MRCELRPTTREDVERFLPGRLTWRIRGITAHVGDRIIGIGGLAYLPDGTVAAFTELSDEARKYPVSLHRAGLRTMAMAKEAGHRCIVALADEFQPAAERWLERLGFVPTIVDGVKVYTCQV